MKKIWILLLAVALFATGAILYFNGQANVLSASEYAYGYFAAGDFALGIFAVGTFSAGIFSIGIFSIGIFSISIFNIALYSVGIFVIAYKKKLPKLFKQALEKDSEEKV
jgi:polyferredoxin